MPATRTTPSIGINDKRFRYRNSVSTDIGKTFERIRRQIKQAQLASTQQSAISLEYKTPTTKPRPPRHANDAP